MRFATLFLSGCVLFSKDVPVYDDTAQLETDAESDADTDADADADSDADTDTDGPPPGASRVFVTSGQYDGDLQSAGNAAGPLLSADALCQLNADGFGLGGTFKAWLSHDGQDAIDRITDVGPWYTMRGQQAFLNAASLASTPTANLSYNERGEIQGSLYWTGTEGGGRVAPFTCDSSFSNHPGWNDGTSGERGTVGNGDSDGDWTEFDERNCNNSLSLLCFEQ